MPMETAPLPDVVLDAARIELDIQTPLCDCKGIPSLMAVLNTYARQAARPQPNPAPLRLARPLPDPRPVQASAKMRAANDGD